MKKLDAYSKEIADLCERHGLGSVLTDRFNAHSDVDLIVDFANIRLEDYADNYFDFKFSLQDIIQSPIDLLEEKAIKNPYFRKAVNQQRRLIYGE